MQTVRSWRLWMAAAFSAVLGLSSLSQACTDARIVAEDGSVTSARSMEFGAPLESRLVVRPRGSSLSSPAPNGAEGLRWKAKYGFVYLDGLQLDAVVDGLNEAGLGIGTLFFPGYAEFETVSPEEHAKALSHLQFGAWVLSRFATAGEVKEALNEVKVWGEALPNFGILPVHYVIHDARGKSIVCEWTGGKLTVYDNTVGVMTNSPPYDWHMINLDNFVGLSPDNAKARKIGGVTYASTGQGSGLWGLPGDPSPPSRLVQTVFGLNASFQPKDSEEALVLAQKLMNRVDIPRGLVRDPATGESDSTQWAVFRDHSNQIYYFRSYGDMTLRALDLRKVNLSEGAPAGRMPFGVAKPTIHLIDPASIPAFK